MATTSVLKLYCHVKPGANAALSVAIDGTSHEFDLHPTIDWVPSSSKEGSQEATVTLDISNSNPAMFEFGISAADNDVLICGYETSRGLFHIHTQPTWNTPGWQPYNISGHQGDDAEFQGNGSLQIMAGQTVTFTAKLDILNPNQNG